MKNRLLIRLAFIATLSTLIFSCLGGKEISSLDTQPPKEIIQEPSPQEQGDDREKPLDVNFPEPSPGDRLTWFDGNFLVYIPPGEFVMGMGGDDNPERMVYLDGFWIYRTEVTNSMYLGCMLKGQCSPPDFDPSIPEIEDPMFSNHPVVGIRWDQAERYCQFVGGHLPTEAQWEKAARGPEGLVYPWGNEEPNCELLNFSECLSRTSSVVTYPDGASPYEILDMAGNVFEWVADWYQPNYYFEAPFDNPMGPEVGEVRSVRGSAFNSVGEQIAIATRSHYSPDNTRFDLGFRCVIPYAQKFSPPCNVIAYVPEDAQGGPGEAPGGSAACVVPQPELSVVTYCDQGIRGNNISWTPADAQLNYSTSDGVSCSQYDADTLACAGSPGGTAQVEVCRSCPPPQVDLGVPASCAPQYVLDEPAGLCRYTGENIPGRDLCAPGFFLQEQGGKVCCEIEGGSPHDFPACPVGGVYDPVSRICWFRLPSTGDEKCASETVYFDSCSRPSGGDGGSGSSCNYSNENSCESNGCLWFCYSTGQGQICGCVQP